MRPVPVPSSDSHGGDINDAGVVVGTMRAGGADAFIYADGVVTNLNSLIPAGTGLHLAYGTGINNAGQIVGVAYDAIGVTWGPIAAPIRSFPRYAANRPQP